jgi:hypothetical protein
MPDDPVDCPMDVSKFYVSDPMSAGWSGGCSTSSLIYSVFAYVVCLRLSPTTIGKSIFASPEATVHEGIASKRWSKPHGKIAIKERGYAHLQSLSPRIQTTSAAPAPLEEHGREKEEGSRQCVASIARSSQRRSFARVENGGVAGHKEVALYRMLTRLPSPRRRCLPRAGARARPPLCHHLPRFPRGGSPRTGRHRCRLGREGANRAPCGQSRGRIAPLLQRMELLPPPHQLAPDPALKTSRPLIRVLIINDNHCRPRFLF